jgi:hypothetical protein
MQRKHFMAGAAVAIIALSAFLIFDFFKPKKRLSPVVEISSLDRLAGLANALRIADATTKKLPSVANYDDDGKPLLSWRVALLPYMQQYQLWSEFNQDEPWDSQHNKQFIEKMPDEFKSPLAGDLGGKTVYLAVTGPGTMFDGKEGRSLSSAGGADTILIVEVEPARAVPWTKPDDLVVDKSNPTAGLARDQQGNFMVGVANGRTASLPGATDPTELWSHFMRSSGEKPK